MVRIAITTLFTLTILVTGPSCHRCKNNFLRRDTPTRVGPSGGGIYLPEPVPTTPNSFPPPTSPFPESSGSFRIDPATPPGAWEPVPTDTTAPLPSKSNKEQWLPETVPNGSGVPPVIDLSGGKSVQPRLGEPIPTGEPETRRDSRTTDRGEPRGLSEFRTVAGHQDTASGRRPTLDGYDWLQTQHYKTVVHLHESTHDLAPVRALVEDRGMRFLPIDVQRNNLIEAYRTFVKAIETPALRPMYVSDEDGLLAGTLWYLTYRLADSRDDDTARILATGLGLPGSISEDQKMWWLAIQNVLASR